MAESDYRQLAVAAIQKFLREEGLSRTLSALESEADLGTAAVNVPALQDLIKSWQLSQHELHSALSANRSHQLVIPSKPTRTLETVHSSNILSLTTRTLSRRRFDTTKADYIQEELPCLVSTSTDKNVSFTDMYTGQNVDIFTPSSSVILCTNFDDNKLITGAMDGSVRFTDLETRQQTERLQDHSRYVVRIALSDDKAFMATAGYDKAIHIYARKDGAWQKVHTETLATNPEAIIFLPDGDYLAYCRRDDYRIYYLSTKTWETASFNLNERQDEHVSFSIMHICRHPTQPLLSLQTNATQSQIFLVPFLSNSRIATFYTTATHSDYSTPRHAWFPDGSALALNSDDGLVTIVDATNGKTIKSIRAHGLIEVDPSAISRPELKARMEKDRGSSNIRDITVYESPNGPVVATCGYDRTIKLIQCSYTS